MESLSDAVLHRSFLRYLAALTGRGLIDDQRVVLALAAGTDIDRQLIHDLGVVTDDLVAAAVQPSLTPASDLLRGHLSVLQQLASIARPEFAPELQLHVERAVTALAALDPVPD